MSENGEIYTAGNKFYTPAGTDGMDKFHLCTKDGENENEISSRIMDPSSNPPRHILRRVK